MASPPDAIVVGFDAREGRRRFATTWSPARGSQFLLSLAIEEPLSTDTSVWPSIFDLGDSRAGCLPDETPALLTSPTVTPPTGPGPVPGMWADLRALRRQLAAVDPGRLAPPTA